MLLRMGKKGEFIWGKEKLRNFLQDVSFLETRQSRNTVCKQSLFMGVIHRFKYMYNRRKGFCCIRITYHVLATCHSRSAFPRPEAAKICWRGVKFIKDNFNKMHEMQYTNVRQ